MRNNSFSLNVPTAVGIGTAQVVRDLRDKYLQFAGTFSATMNVEVSLNGVDYLAIATGITSAQFVAIPHPASHVRVRVTGYTSGTPVATVAGFDENG